MTAATLRSWRLREPHSRPLGWWGMVLLIATEAALFAYLLFSYFYVGSLGPAWPPTGPRELTLALPNTILLLASSGTMIWAERSARRGRQGGLRLGLLLTFAMGIVFLGIQLREYGQASFTPQTDSYGSLFYTITGFHGAHVLAGLLMLAVIQIRAWLGHFGPRRHEAVSNVALYWHFVDAVWLAVFTSLYLTPRLG
jgi:heme/copper-type cytochrome/quinol oxidase subunit 3